MKFRILYCFCFLILLACSKKDSSTPDSTYVDATGTWSVQSIKGSGDGINLQYNATDHPCLSENKYEFKSAASGRFYFAGTDSCYVYQNGSTYVVTGTPGTENALTWQQIKDSVIITYAVSSKDTGIVSTAGGKNYLNIANHYSTGYVNTVICTK